MKKSSFKKGEEFENFVENNSFSKKDFSLIHRTSNKAQNKERFAYNTKLPDFKFRSVKTLNEFYVEAKYRSKFDSNNQLDLLSESQFNRFNMLERKEKIPVYIIIGFSGGSDNPEKIFFVPLEDLKNEKVTETFINKYSISKVTVNECNLKLSEYFNENEAKENIKLSRNYKKIIPILLVSFLSLFLVYNLLFKYSIAEKAIPKLISNKAISTKKTEQTWIDDFREFRDAVYQGNRPKLSGFLYFPLSSNFHGDINEGDFDKYYDDFFNEAFISRILKVKSQIVFDEFYYETEEIIIDELTYYMVVQYDDINKILSIRLNDRDSDLESSVLYDFKVIKNKIYLFNIDMAG